MCDLVLLLDGCVWWVEQVESYRSMINEGLRELRKQLRMLE
jgi:hypothetical protein